ncbi:MAG: hypothetical protein EOO60_10540 [Hymenobacter sp.]|nr:MAG: hypothetical protein EOO60_10540 [Hymenobacter sp.]
MCRAHSSSCEESEANQISGLTGVDFSPLYEMQHYIQPEDLASMLEYAEDEEGKQESIQQAEEANAAAADNIDRVTATINALLKKLAAIEDLSSEMVPNSFKRAFHREYFSHFALTKWNEYDNTFGQDLRNCKNFLDYAKSKGSTTVFFVFG